MSRFVTVIHETWRHANAYIVHGQKNYLIDPSIAFDPERCPNLDVILATHGHYDHIAELETWRTETEAPFWLGKPDSILLRDEHANASLLFGQPKKFKDADRWLCDGEHIDLDAQLCLDVFLFPGHTPGSAFYLFSHRNESSAQKEYEPVALFTGDVIFATSIGRTDLMCGDAEAMAESLARAKRLLGQLPPSCPLYAGHDRPTTVGTCLQINPYLR